MTEQDPYAAFREDDGIPSNLLNVVRQLADNQQAQEAEVERLQKELDAAEAILKNIKESDIPRALEGLHGKFDLKDGRVLELDQKIRASIAGEKTPPAVQWLDANGYGHIVKREVAIRFAKDDKKSRDAFLTMMVEFQKQIDKILDYDEKYTVHWMTLESWVREMLKEGVEVPKDIFGIYTQYISKITGVKKDANSDRPDF